MLEHIQNLSEEEKNIIIHSPLYVSVLIAGADGDVTSGEKKRILELYLNVAEWGPGVFGAEEAARHHFGKSAVDVSPEEAALLAAMLPSPRRYDLTRPTSYLLKRQQEILEWMRKTE